MKNSVITYPFICSLVIHFCLISGFGLNYPKEPKAQKKKQIKITLKKQDLIPDIKRLSLKKELTDAQASENRKILPVSEKSGDFSQKKPDRLKKSANNKEEIFITNPDKDDLLRFEDLIKRKIQKARFYPIWGKKQGLEGITQISFLIDQNGLAKGIKILSSSGYDVLDQAALKTVKKASPFPKIPQILSKSTIKLTIDIEFCLNNSQ